MQNVASSGRTIIFVSHNMGSIEQLCNRGLLIQEGRVGFDGDVSQTIERYLAGGKHESLTLGREQFTGHLLDEIAIKTMTVNGIGLGMSMVFNPLETITFQFNGTSRLTLSDFDLFVVIYKNGLRIATCHDSEPGTTLNEGTFTSVITLPAKSLRPGIYTIQIGGERRGRGDWFVSNDIGRFKLMDKWTDDYTSRSVGVVNITTKSERKQINE